MSEIDELIRRSRLLLQARNLMIENSTPQNIDSFLLEFVRFSNYAHRSPYSDIITQQESFLRNDIAHADYVMSINSTTMKRLIDTIDKISQRVMAAMKR